METGNQQVKWTFEELENIQSLMERQRYSHADRLQIYDLYNRIFNTQKHPTSCGKCVVNTLNGLRTTYRNELEKRK